MKYKALRPLVVPLLCLGTTAQGLAMGYKFHRPLAFEVLAIV